MKLRSSALALLAVSGNAVGGSVTIGVDQPEDGTKYALLCERIESTLLTVNGDVKWGGLPTYKGVVGSQRVEPCPMSQGNWFEVPTQALRNYQITARLVRYDAKGEVLYERVLPSYAWFDSGAKQPKPPVVLLSV